VLAGVARQESAWTRTARSGAGAVGLAQVLPATARELIRDARLPAAWARDLTEPTANLTIGGLLLARWRARLGSWPAGLAAYNAGERRVRELVARNGHDDGPELVEAIEIPETHDYVHRVVLLAEGYRLLYWPDGRPYPWT
jgi:soluble lytic murein transglycosylase